MNSYSRKILLIPIVIFLGAGCLSKNPAEISNSGAANIVAEKPDERNAQLGESVAMTKQVNSPPAATPLPVASKPENAVCPDPNKPFRHKSKEFSEWEMSFGLPARIVPNKLYESAAFYAVVLKKFKEGCTELDYNSAIEPERLEIQNSYPTRKVFAAYDCPNMDSVSYNFAGKRNKDDEDIYGDFIAVFAGETPAEADKILAEALRDFPQAELKKMTVSWSKIVQ